MARKKKENSVDPKTVDDVEFDRMIAAGVARLKENGMSEEDAEKYARCVCADLRNLRTMVLKRPLFSQMVDLLEVFIGVSIPDNLQVRVKAERFADFDLRSIDELIWMVYMFGFFHGILQVEMDKGNEISSEKTETLFNDVATLMYSLQRACGLVKIVQDGITKEVLPEKAIKPEVNIKEILEKKKSVIKNTAVDDF
jgi:hypothetical protein